MLNIYICEDNKNQREALERIVKDIILIENYDVKMEMSTNDPLLLLKHLKEDGRRGIYFLDVELKSDINGIELASKIREMDPRGFIIFITTHAEMSYLTFTYKVEAMDYIIKDNIGKIKERVHDCISKAYGRYTSDPKEQLKVLNIKVNDRIINIEFSQILFIETAATVHKLVVHAVNRQVEFYAKLKEILSQLDERFYRCHNSIIVNKDYIKEIDAEERCIYMVSGDKCQMSMRMLKGLTK